MRTVGLFAAKQRLSHLVDEAARGQAVGITCRGELKAVLTPAPRKAKRPLADLFASLRGSMRLPAGATTKSLLDEGRRF